MSLSMLFVRMFSRLTGTLVYWHFERKNEKLSININEYLPKDINKIICEYNDLQPQSQYLDRIDYNISVDVIALIFSIIFYISICCLYPLLLFKTDRTGGICFLIIYTFVIIFSYPMIRNDIRGIHTNFPYPLV